MTYHAKDEQTIPFGAQGIKKKEEEMLKKLLALTIIAVCCSLIWAQQIKDEITPIPLTPQEKQDLLQRSGPSDIWNQPWSKGTRTDLAPKLEEKEKPKSYCEPSEKVKRIYENAWQLQNSRGQIPLLQPIINAEALKIANEEWEKDCQNQANDNNVETRTVWGPAK
jgi:hypothetical protein